MADTTDKKNYLINFESNLKKYIEELIEAKKKLADAKKAVEDLNTGQLKSREEIEKVNAAYRQAKTDVSNATKQVDLATKANKANAGSYEQLYRQWQLAQTQLKLMGGAYTINEKGIRVLSQRYIEQKKVVEDAKRSLDAFGKGIADNRLNVANYSEAIEGALGKFQGLGGAAGVAARGVGVVNMAFKTLLANPIIAAIATIVGVFAGLVKIFKSTAEGGGKIRELFASIGAIINELRARVVSFINIFQHVFKGEWKEAGQAAKETFTGLGEAIKEVVTEAAEFSRIQTQLTKELAFHISEEAKENNLIQKYLYLSKDKSKSDADRIKYLKESIRIGTENAQKEVDYAKRQFDIDVGNAALKTKMDKKTLADWIAMDADKQERVLKGSAELQKAYNLLGPELLKSLEESYAKGIEADTAFYEHNKRTASLLSGLMEEFLAAPLKAMEESKKALNKEIDDFRKLQADKRKADLEAAEKKKEDILAQQEWEKERELINQDNLLAIREANNDDVFNLERARLEQQHKAEVDNAEKTGADINIINAKFAAAQRQIDEAEQVAKLGLYADFAGNLATIFGKNTAIGKAAAIAQTTIATYTAAMEAYKALAGVPIVGPVLGIAAAAAAIAAGIENIKKIVAVKSGLPGEGAVSAPTSIITSVPRSFAIPAGSTIFTQPQLIQTQLNALPSQSLLTADDIANALSKMPAPIVTVEDINAKAASKNKVEVRANI